METSADKDLDEVRQHIQDAIFKLSDIVTGKTFGSDDYYPSFKNKVKVSFDLLLKVKSLLGS